MRIPVPRSMRGRARLRRVVVAVFLLLGLACSGGSYLSTRAVALGSPHAHLIGLWSAVLDAATVGLLAFALVGDRPRPILARLSAACMTVGFAPGFCWLLVSRLGMSPVPAWIVTGSTSIVVFWQLQQSLSRVVVRLLVSGTVVVPEHRAERVLEHVGKARGEKLDEEDAKGLRISEARALIASATSGARPDGLVRAAALLNQVRADPPRDPVRLFNALFTLVEALQAKAHSHHDFAGYPEALEALAAVMDLLPDDAAAGWVDVHTAYAQYEADLAGRMPSDGHAEAHVNAAISRYRRAVSVASAAARPRLPQLYLELAAQLGIRDQPSDLTEAIAFCRMARQLVGRRGHRAREADLILASLLTQRADSEWATAETAECDLDEAERLCRPLTERRCEQRLNALEQRAETLSTWARLFPDGPPTAEIAVAMRASATGSERGAADTALRTARMWVDWATTQDDAAVTAEAYHHLMATVPRAAFGKYLWAAKETLLTRVQSTAGEAGYWLSRAGRPRDAAVALERGRAVLISEVAARERPDLDRLVAGVRRPGLSARYHGAVRRLREVESRPGVPGFAFGLQRAAAEYETVAWEVARLGGYAHVVPDVTYEDIAAATGAGPVVYLAAAERGGYAVVVRDAGDPEIVRLPGLSAAAVAEHVGAATGGYDQDSLDRTVTFLWTAGIGALAARLPRDAVTTLVPVGALSHLPLHAAGHRSGPEDAWHCLADDVTLRYSPNARSLVTSWRRAAAFQGRPLRLLAVDAPNGHRRAPAARLRHTRDETEHVIRGWRAGGDHAGQVPGARRHEVLTALDGHDVWHFACHGVARPDQILDSALLLTDGSVTLRDLGAVVFRVRRLAVLSACETHTTSSDAPDESLGLPGGMLQIGLAGVVASQWKVTDQAAVFLVARFYQGWRSEGLSPAAALTGAQRWLSRATRADLHAYLPHVYPLESWLPQPERDRRPFAHPYFWAPLVLTGD
ncbi:CHAT domain-containing protein [Longispora sp. NPDC051575]|uniref:CHAT domain-containing protein n=1 Tax=Longispora sp. NPDC051575 TaxID=3154943 RepID=UPI0034486B01